MVKGGCTMFKWLVRLFQRPSTRSGFNLDCDPVYGLPRSAIDRWLAHNPQLKEEYAAELRRRGEPDRKAAA